MMMLSNIRNVFPEIGARGALGSKSAGKYLSQTKSPKKDDSKKVLRDSNPEPTDTIVVPIDHWTFLVEGW